MNPWRKGRSRSTPVKKRDMMSRSAWRWSGPPRRGATPRDDRRGDGSGVPVASGSMNIGLQVWGQFVEWDELMEAGKRIEGLGFSSLWSNDHFYPSFGAEDGPVLEGWITLAGWAVLTERIPLGCMVSGAAYRNPALLVKMATTVDRASHGRLTLGLGAGWHEREHRAFGYALLKPGARIARLAEAAEIARGLLAGGPVTVKGSHFSVDGPRPRRRRDVALCRHGGRGRDDSARVRRDRRERGHL